MGKIIHILHCDWLPERTRWSYLARSGQPAMSHKKNIPESHIINPLLTKFVRSRWLDIVLVLFCEHMDLDSVSVHKHAKKELGQYPVMLTSNLVNNPYVLGKRDINFPWDKFCSTISKHFPYDNCQRASRAKTLSWRGGRE